MVESRITIHELSDAMFQPPRDRDASASIRGYVFQVDRTVERWLRLEADQVLELERGEDIDLVSRMIVAGEESGTEARLLEQIKHREPTLTLRTDAALEALANFHDHRRHNPGNDLRFCFLTNAVIGSERLNPFPNRIPGIALWEQIRTLQWSEDGVPAAVGQLRQFLANQAKPSSLPDAVWGAWMGFLVSASTQELRAFIDRVEWSTGQPDAKQLPAAVRAILISLGHARDGSEADAVADRLFVHVMRLLSTSGTKRLTVEDLHGVLAAPTLASADRDILAHLRAIVAEHADRLDRLEADMTVLGGQVETLVLAGTTQRVGLAVPTPDLSLPTPVSRLSPRRETVATLRNVVDTSPWLALHGGPDTGKSQLAIQISGALDAQRMWVRFHHGQPCEEAFRILEAALVTMAGWRQPPARADWFAEAFSAAGSNCIIVLDDLPRIPGDAPFTDWLTRMAQAARTAGIRLLSTSQFELPHRLRYALGDTHVTDRPVPPFTDTEAGELFRAFGANATLLQERRLRFLNNLAAGHPLLLAATAEFLAHRSWSYCEEDIDALLRGDHTRQLLPEVVDRLVRTLGESPRQFLYRLSLPIGSFDQSEMAALAYVMPAVERPTEHLNELLGAWVQRDTDTRFAVSPLVKPLGRSELAPEVRKNCYRQLAEVIAFKREMNPLEGERAIFYNLEAGENGRALTLYLLFLAETIREPLAEHVVPLIDKWRAKPLPEDQSVPFRLFVRAYQLAAFTKLKLDTRFILRDTDALLAQATDYDGWAILSLVVQNMRWLGPIDPGRLLGYVRRTMDLPRIVGPNGQAMEFDFISIPDLLWMAGAYLTTPDLLRQWFDAVEAIPKRHRAPFWDSELGRQGVWILPNKVYTTEWEKPKQKQDWDGVLRALEDVLGRAERLRQPRLEAVLTGTMLDILGDRERTNETPRVAERTLARWPSDPDVQFRVKGIWGRQYAHEEQPERALALIDAALAEPHSPDDHGRLRCLLSANICVGVQDLRYAERARDLARTSANAPAIQAARALGEYAISLFCTQGGQAGAIAAFPAWSEAMRRYFAVPDKGMIWRDLFPLFAHASSYFFHLAHDGAAPEKTIEGDVFVAPTRGFLLKDYMPGREAYYSESGHSSLALLMQAYATAARADEESAFWMMMAVEESRRTGATAIQVASGSAAVAHMLAASRFEDAFEMAVFVGRGMVATRARGERTRETFEGVGFDVATAFRALPEDQRHIGDRFAVITGLIPAAMAVVRLSLTDPVAAVVAGNRVAAMCRQLAEEPSGDRELWSTATAFFEISSVECTNTSQIIASIETIEGDSEREVALRILGYTLCSWHASPGDAIGSQLGMMETSLRWYSPGEAVYRLVLMPFIESYWRFIAENRRFALRAPDIVTAALESASLSPERERVYAVLSAAAQGFRIRGASERLQRIRAAFA